MRIIEEEDIEKMEEINKEILKKDPKGWKAYEINIKTCVVCLGRPELDGFETKFMHMVYDEKRINMVCSSCTEMISNNFVLLKE